MFKLDSVFRAGGFGDMKNLVSHFVEQQRQQAMSEASALKDKDSGSASRQESKSTAASSDNEISDMNSSVESGSLYDDITERVFNIVIRENDNSSKYKRVDEYKTRSGFVLVTQGTTLKSLRRLIREAHGAEFTDDNMSVCGDDSDDDDSDEEDEEDQIEFLNLGKFSFGLKSKLDGEDAFLKVTKKQEKTFVLKKLSGDELCVFETGAGSKGKDKDDGAKGAKENSKEKSPKADSSAAAASLPGQPSTEEKEKP